MRRECKDFEFLIAQFVDGEIQEDGKAEVLFHLAECGACRSFWETVMQLKSLAVQEKRMAAPASLDNRISGIASRNVHTRVSAEVWTKLVQFRLLLPAPAAFVLALLLLVGGAGIAFAWIPRLQVTKEVVEPVVYMRLPTVQIRGEISQPKPTFR
jgi:anti-sigma factor RsiW